MSHHTPRVQRETVQYRSQPPPAEIARAVLKPIERAAPVEFAGTAASSMATTESWRAPSGKDQRAENTPFWPRRNPVPFAIKPPDIQHSPATPPRSGTGGSTRGRPRRRAKLRPDARSRSGAWSRARPSNWTRSRNANSGLAAPEVRGMRLPQRLICKRKTVSGRLLAGLDPRPSGALSGCNLSPRRCRHYALRPDYNRFGIFFRSTSFLGSAHLPAGRR